VGEQSVTTCRRDNVGTSPRHVEHDCWPTNGSTGDPVEGSECVGPAGVIGGLKKWCPRASASYIFCVYGRVSAGIWCSPDPPGDGETVELQIPLETRPETPKMARLARQGLHFLHFWLVISASSTKNVRNYVPTPAERTGETGVPSPATWARLFSLGVWERNFFIFGSCRALRAKNGRAPVFSGAHPTFLPASVTRAPKRQLERDAACLVGMSRR